MEATARTRYLKGSPRKARLVIDLVRGKNVSQALAILHFANKRAATPIAKCIRSAVANATYSAEQQNIAIDPDDLWIKKCFVDMGPTKNRRRLRPAPQGRAYQERRHYCHITIELTSEVPEAEEEAPVKKKSKAVDTKKKSAKSEAPVKQKAAKPKTEKAAEKKDDVKSETEPKAEKKKEEKVAEKPAELKKEAPAKKEEKKQAEEKKAEADKPLETKDSDDAKKEKTAPAKKDDLKEDAKLSDKKSDDTKDEKKEKQ